MRDIERSALPSDTDNMATPFILIDGYNVLHAAGLARVTYGPGDLERCRHRLLRLLVGLLDDEERQRAKVIFDAHDAPADLPRKSSFEGLQILFAEAGSDADSLIEELIARHSAPRQILVVSGDRRLQKAARRRRAKSIESFTFLEELLHRPETKPTEFEREPNPKYDPQLSAGELAEWANLFEDVGALIEEEEARRERERTERLREDVESTTGRADDGAEGTDEERENEWEELLAELGLDSELTDEIAEEFAREVERERSQSGELERLQEEINRIIEEEGDSF